MKITKGQLRRIIKEVILEVASSNASPGEGEEYVGTQAVKVTSPKEISGTKADLQAAVATKNKACSSQGGDSSACKSASAAVVTLQKKLDDLAQA